MSAKLPALTDLAGAQVPTDEMYVVRPGIDPLGSFRSFLNDLFEQPPKNITDGVMKGLTGSGVNGGGGDLGLSGGRGTGLGIPGRVGVRYPLIGASGSTLQTLSTDLHLPITNQYSTITPGTLISNTAAEVSLFATLAPSAGSTRIIEGGIARLGTQYKIRATGNFSNTGTPTLQIRVKLGPLGTVTVIDCTATATAANFTGRFWLEININVVDNDATGLIDGFVRFDYSNANSGAATIATINGATGGAVVDFSVNNTIDVSIQWGTAAGANALQVFDMTIDRRR